MKSTIMIFVFFASSLASASNGSGTMKVASSQIPSLDLTAVVVIRFDGITVDNQISISKVLGNLEDGRLITLPLVVSPRRISPEWRDALKESAASSSWLAVQQDGQKTTTMDRD